MFIAHIREDGKKQSVKEHLEGTAGIAEKMGLEAGLAVTMKLTGLLHDIGKNTKRFYDYIVTAFTDPRSVHRGEVNHSSAGGKFIHERYYEKGNTAEKLTAQIISNAIISHHGLTDSISTSGEDKYTERICPQKEIYYDEAVENSKDIFEKYDIDELFHESVKEIDVILVKMKELTNRVKGGGSFLHFYIGALERLVLSILTDADSIDTAEFMNGRAGQAVEKTVDKIEKTDLTNIWTEFQQKLENRLAGFDKTDAITLLRKQMSDECFEFAVQNPGIYCLPIPTGGGKTYCSFRFAIEHAIKYRKSRILYTAPFLSILEQTADNIRGILDENGEKFSDKVLLEYHSNMVVDKDSEDNYGREKPDKILTENFGFPIVLTTQMQLLNALFAKPRQCIRRMHQLVNSVIIIDEVQSLPVKCVSLFNSMMNFLSYCMNTTVVLCSATQPLLGDTGRKILYGQPVNMIKDVDKRIIDFKRVEIVNSIKAQPYNSEELAQFILEKFDENMLIILNTKKAVKSLYKELEKTAPPGIKLVELTTYMCAEQRSDIIKELKENMGGVKIICVSTQLIEAGVDISFQKVVRSVAGLDSIWQAAGRCNRNGEIDKGQVFIVNFEDENVKMLPDIKVAQNCMESFLYDFKSTPSVYDDDYLSLKSIERYYSLYFFSRKAEMDYKIKKQSYTLYDLLSDNEYSYKAYKGKTGKTCTWLIKQAFKQAASEFEVIDDGDTIGVIVPYKDAKKSIEIIKNSRDYSEIKRELKKLQRYTVNVFKNDKILDKSVFETILDGTVYILDEEFYGEHGIENEKLADLIF
ncbi:MAG: CRISPR-associated helicase Cas3' [Clostridiales bacterium]|jgi:CRISPR-associated endonuclease/helicase Cas3|nr:CRISPR-associated helicase Cas3' [Clostridiales bacterium]